MRTAWASASLAAAVAALGAMVLVSGCRVSSDKHGDGDNVKISTPFGGMQVKTDNASVLNEIGLPVYPGAALVQDDKNKSSADVNLSFGSFHLKVNAVSYRTSDAPDMVTAFYRKALEKYGDVIQCHGNKTIGTPERTSEGLTCDDNGGGHVSVSDEGSGKIELKTGSKQRQHIVEINPEGAGTKFGLVALELPDHVSVGSHNGDKQ